MKFLKISIIVSVLLLINSCFSSIPVHPNFYTNGNKLGIIVQTNDIMLSQQGPRGGLELLITSGSRFKTGLDSIAPNFDFRERIKGVVTAGLSNKGKDFEFLPDSIDLTNLEIFKKPENSKQNYSIRDLRPLKEQFGVNEILVVDVKYGLAVGYYGMIETGKNGFAIIETEFVNLNHNSVMAREQFQTMGKMKGNWKKDNYSPLIKSINDAMDKSIKDMREKF